MKILLDTCTFLWIIERSAKLSKHAIRIFREPENQIYLSTVSSWEIMLKASLGKIRFADDAGRFLRDQREMHGILSLPLQETATSFLSRLPQHHRDPFDRMLICQALCDGLTLLTPDREILQYPVPVEW